MNGSSSRASLPLPEIGTRNKRRLALIAFTAAAACLLYLMARYIGLPRLVDSSKLLPVTPWMVLEAIAFSVPLFFLGFIFVSRSSKGEARLGHYLVFFGIRLILAIVLAFLFFFDDERGFHYAAISRNFGFFLWQPGKAFYNLANVTYELFGSNILMLRTFNVFLGSLMPFLAMDVARSLFDDELAGRRAMLYTGLLPPLVFFSAVALKEVPTGLLILAFLRHLVSAEKKAMPRLAGILATLLLLYWLRGILFVLPCVIGIAIYYSFGERPVRGKFRKKGYIQAAIIFALLALAFLPVLAPSVEKAVNERIADEETAEAQAAESSALVFRYIRAARPYSPQSQAILFLRGVYAPTPLSVFASMNVDGIISSISMTVWYVLFPLAIVCFIEWKRRSGVLVTGIIMLMMLYMITIGVSAGTNVYRHRMTIIVLLYLLASEAPALQKKRNWVLYLWWVGALLYTGLWSALRF